ncbi:site-specific tyrosine recombinase XerC [compost metagenome]
MFIEVRGVIDAKKGGRSYIIFYYNGKRYRLYNGKHLGLEIQPNKGELTQKKISASIELLRFKTMQALDDGWNPEEGNYIASDALLEEKNEKCVSSVFKSILESKTSSGISNSYKNDLTYLVNNFLNFLTKAEKDNNISELRSDRIVEFLDSFNSSATNYNNKRRMLSVLFNCIIERGYLLENPLKKTRKQKQKVVLNDVYTDGEFKNLLRFLQENNNDLYVMGLIMYGCLLRPHTEILSLTRGNFNEDFSIINLGGNENKSGKIRKVNVPEYVREAIQDRIPLMKKDNTNLFTLANRKFNVGYFNTLWDRLKDKMIEKSILKANQTIYSIRHTSAVKIYKKCKDVSIVQKMMGHSSMAVTLTYLRSLGQMEVESLLEYIPAV